MNKLVIFFHFEIIGTEFVLKTFTKVWYMKHSKYMGKYSHGSSLHYISLFTGFLQLTSKINIMLFQNLDVLGRYYDTIWTYVCCNFRHCKVHTHIQACIF